LKNEALVLPSIPAAWKSQSLAKISAVFTDGNWIESKDQADSGVRLVQTGNVGIGHFKDRFEKARFIDEPTFARLKCFEVLPGDILISRLPDPVGRACIIPDTGQKMITAVDCSIVRVRDAAIDAKFLVYYSQTQDYVRAVDVLCSGTTRRRISRKNLGNVPVPLPPLEEQKRIVAVLDLAFAALDRARAHAEANLADAKQFFVNSLRAVFSNESTKWASAADTPAITSNRASRVTKTRSKVSTQTGGREAATRRIEGDYSLSVLQPDAAARPGWVWSSLSDLAKLESGHTPSRKHPEYWGGTIGWLGIRDARDHHGGEILETSEQTNDLGIANSSARILPARTICLSRTASVGYVVKMGVAMSTSQDFVNWICGEELEPDFLMLLLLAQGQDIRRFASGSVHQTIYFPEVKAFSICHPSVAIQRAICDSFKEIRVRAVSLIDAYEQKLTDLANLRQSLLQKAFSGELT
jgi:type I restriction enzyme S subunit